jgi:gliding-associated putative ABC transporter substrate-binding component GldG
MNKKDILIKTLIIIGIIVAINVIAKRVFTRVDLTKNKSYTLSDISKKIVSELDDKVLVKAYFSENLPAPYNNLRRQVQDILDDYRSYSGGNLNYEFINTTSSSEGEASELDKEAQKYGIQPVQIQAMDNDKLEVKRAYLGLVFLYGGKQESIPVVQSVDNLEYDITTILKRFETAEKRKVGFLTGHGEVELSKMQQTQKILSDQYDVVTVDLKTTAEVEPGVGVLLVMAPKGPISEGEKFKIDQYIMRGGNVAFLIDKINPNFQQQMVIGNPVNTNLDDMLQSYGISMRSDLIRDLQSSTVQVQSAIGFPISMNYPYFPAITNIAKDNPAFKNIKSVTLTYASSLDLNYASGKNLDVKPLLTTSDKSGQVVDFFFLNLEQFQNMTKASVDTLFDEKGYVVGATYAGKFRSFFDGKEMPGDTSQSWVAFSGERKSASDKDSRIIAIGDGDFANEESRPPRENIIFLVNLVEYMMDDVGLAEIRTKISPESPIEETSEDTKRFMKYFNLIFPSALVLVFGLLAWKRRNDRKKSMQAKSN